tara:strand:- start:393 stop:503 length:111 start_codon:yes stop_codon:yes gene_type:complete
VKLLIKQYRKRNIMPGYMKKVMKKKSPIKRKKGKKK